MSNSERKVQNIDQISNVSEARAENVSEDIDQPTLEQGLAQDFNVYWIDDYTEQVYSIAEGAISVLWDINLSSGIYLFGDGNWDIGAKKGPSAQNKINLNKKITQIFYNTCIETDRIYWLEEGETYKNKKQLIRADKYGIGRIAEIVPFDAEGKNEINKIIQAWSDDSKLLDLKEAGETSDVDKKLKKFGLEIDALFTQMVIPQNSTVALDVRLLRNDHINIIEKALPSISMAIYYWCKRNGRRCYIYSRYTYEDKLTENWKSTYLSVFDSNEDAKIHPENCLIKKDEDEKHIRELIKLIGGNTIEV